MASDDMALLKGRAKAILAQEAHQHPKPGQRLDHDTPDMSHPDQSQDDAEARRRGLHPKPPRSHGRH